MKPIKFRVWNPKYETFFYWGFVKPDAFAGIPTGTELTIDYVRKHSEQFTGLTDKNGKEIYEGDVVEYQKVVRGKVFMRLGCWFIENYKELGYCDDIEIIGNVYENLDLLK